MLPRNRTDKQHDEVDVQGMRYESEYHLRVLAGDELFQVTVASGPAGIDFPGGDRSGIRCGDREGCQYRQKANAHKHIIRMVSNPCSCLLYRHGALCCCYLEVFTGILKE